MSENIKGTFGQTSWDIDTGTSFKKNEKSSKDLYLRLDDGNNVIRILTKPFEYMVHKSFKPNAKDPGWGNRVMSSIFHGRDPLMEAPWNLKPSRRWLVYCIDRKTQSLKLLDLSKSVFDSIKELVRDDSWGDVINYDLNIKVNKSVQGAVGYYTVIPKSKTPLTASDLELKQNIDFEDLKRRCTPPLPEEVAKRVAAIIAKSGGVAAAASSNSVAEVVVQQSSNDEDDSFDFPVVNG